MTRQGAIEDLTGKGSGLPRPAHITETGGGGKFTPEGKVLPFPGNTFICHIAKGTAAHAALSRLKSGLASGPSGRFFTFLPSSSFHMIVFPAVCGDPPGHDGWPERCEAGATLDQMTAQFRADLADKTAFATCTIAPRGLYLGYSLTVEGATSADARKISDAREMLQDLTGLRRPDFTTYRQHISLCYQTEWMSEDQAGVHLDHADRLYAVFAAEITEIPLGPVEFCTFADMYHFEPLCTVPTPA